MAQAAVGLGKVLGVPSSVKSRGHPLSPRCATSITLCFFLKPTWKDSSKNCDLTFTPRAPTTLPKPCQSALLPLVLAFAWLSLETPRIIRHVRSSTLFVGRLMTEPRFLIVRLGSLGDIVHTFPAVAGLRESFHRAEIVGLTHHRRKALDERSKLA